VRVLIVLNLLAWGGLTWLGVDIIEGVRNQHAPGYPNSGQISYYIGFPCVMLALAVGTFAIARYTRFKVTAVRIQVLILLVVLPFLLLSGGGV
jgi:hypothetical protein